MEEADHCFEPPFSRAGQEVSDRRHRPVRPRTNADVSLFPNEIASSSDGAAAYAEAGPTDEAGENEEGE